MCSWIPLTVIVTVNLLIHLATGTTQPILPPIQKSSLRLFHRPQVFATTKQQPNFRINQGGIYLAVVTDSGLFNFVHSLCRPITHPTVISIVVGSV